MGVLSVALTSFFLWLDSDPPNPSIWLTVFEFIMCQLLYFPFFFGVTWGSWLLLKELKQVMFNR